jgi:tRNA(Ile)-lysidine synthetase-like protein
MAGRSLAPVQRRGVGRLGPLAREIVHLPGLQSASGRAAEAQMNEDLAVLKESIRAFIARHHMISPGAPVVVAVSGGPDSLCLLHALAALRDELGCALHVAHLDHMIRGAESAAEAAFVAELARAWGLAATVESADVLALARARRANLHAAARDARYAFLARVAQAVGAQAVAVAHQADDQAETVLMHLLRGAGPAGLRGMRPVVAWEEWGLGVWDWEAGSSSSPIPNPHSLIPNPCLVRPLLATPRDAIEAYCAEHGLVPRRDPTNFDLGATRNRIRHELLPLLIEYNPRIVAALGRTAEVCAEDQAFVSAALEQIWPRVARERRGAIDFDGAAWRELHPALQRAAIREAHRRLAARTPLSLEQVERARAICAGGVGQRAELPGGVPLTVGYGGAFTIGEPAPPEGPQLPFEAAELPEKDRVALDGGWAIEVMRVPAPAPVGRWEIALDAAALAGPLLVRRPRAGDRVRLPGGRGSQRLQDLFVDTKTPRALRAAWPVIACGDTVVWVAGLRADEQFLATPASVQVVTIRLVRDT